MIKWSKEQTDWLIENYPNLGKGKSAETLGIPPGSVVRKVQYLGLKLNKDVAKELKKPAYKTRSLKKLEKKEQIINGTDWNNFLDLNDETIYLLGYIWADGYLRKNTCNNYYISLSIVQNDAKAIQHIIDKFGYNHKKFKHHVYFPKNKNHQPISTFLISDWRLGYFFYLFDYGIKSYSQPIKILKLIPENKHHLFYLGYSDGDGHIHFDKHHFLWSISSQSSQNWTFLIEKFEQLSLKYKIRIDKREKGSTGNFLAKGKVDALKWCSYLYQSYLLNNIGLKRKRVKFEQELQRVRQNLRQNLELASVVPELRLHG